MSANPSRRRRPFLALLLAALALPALTACGAGFRAQTNIPQDPGDGVEVISGDISVLNALVISAPEGSDTSVISLTVANNGTSEEQLTGITSDSGTVELTGDTRVPAAGTLQVGTGEHVGATGFIKGMDRKPGESVVLTVNLSQSGAVRVETYIYPPEGIYAEVTAPPET